MHSLGLHIPMEPPCFGLDQGTKAITIRHHQTDFDRVTARTEAGSLDIKDGG